MSAVQSIKLNTAATSFNENGIYTTSAIKVGGYKMIHSDGLNSVLLDDVGKYSVYDIADWFLTKDNMTHKKLQKLCYYAQAWCYALKQYRLENTDFEAWVHGPVSPALWERFKAFGYNTICIKGKPSFSFDEGDLKLLEDVWDTYGASSGNELEALTHRELPWIEARNGYEPEEPCSVVISPATMAIYYKSIYSSD